WRGKAGHGGRSEFYRTLKQVDRDAEAIGLQLELRLRDHGVARLKADLETRPALVIGATRRLGDGLSSRHGRVLRQLHLPAALLGAGLLLRVVAPTSRQLK